MASSVENCLMLAHPHAQWPLEKHRISKGRTYPSKVPGRLEKRVKDGP